MNLKKTVISTSVALAMGGISLSSNAALINGSSTLTIAAGSQFTMAPVPTPSGAIAVPILGGLQDGVRIGKTQGIANSHLSHSGTAHASKGRIDQEWDFFGNAGQHFTDVAPTVLSDSGTTKTLDFSGWNVSWNGIAKIDMGGGIQNCGTTAEDFCGNGSVGTFDNGTGIATITCSTSSCSNTSTYTLTYNAVVPQGDPSNFGGVNYGLTLTGHVNSVPVPAAVWLFGSGLLGLVGVARRKKAQ